MNEFRVPVVDLADLERASSRAATLEAIDHACREVGFLQILGHDVAPWTISAFLDALDGFFALPLDEKLAARPPRASVNRGYAPRGSESLAYSLGRESPPDLFEAFNLGPESTPDAGVFAAADETSFAPNIWPEGVAGFREAAVPYFDAIVGLAHRLTCAFASSLGIDPDFFEPHTDHSTDMMRANCYSLVAGTEPLAGQLGMGPHTDYGIVTVLYADRVAGLQIVDPDGVWRDVLPDPGAFLVNLGDLLATWTNDRWRSTVHRVLPPERSGERATRRRSIAFFHDGNFDALVECLPSCVSGEQPAKYPPIFAGEHLKAKLLGPRTMQRSEAASTLGDRVSAVDS